MKHSTRDRLIDAAADLFYLSGFQVVGLDQIIQAVGITKTAFYKHFECKDDLILAVLDRRDRQDIAEAISEMRRRGGGDPRAQVLAFFDLLAEWFEQPSFRGCLFNNAATEFASPNHPIHRAAAAHGEHIATEMLLRVQAAGLPDPLRVTKQLMVLISGAIAARHAGNVLDAATTARETAEFLLSVPARAPACDTPPVDQSSGAARATKRRPARAGR